MTAKRKRTEPPVHRLLSPIEPGTNQHHRWWVARCACGEYREAVTPAAAASMLTRHANQATKANHPAGKGRKK